MIIVIAAGSKKSSRWCTPIISNWLEVPIRRVLYDGGVCSCMSVMDVFLLIRSDDIIRSLCVHDFWVIEGSQGEGDRLYLVGTELFYNLTSIRALYLLYVEPCQLNYLCRMYALSGLWVVCLNSGSSHSRNSGTRRTCFLCTSIFARFQVSRKWKIVRIQSWNHNIRVGGWGLSANRQFRFGYEWWGTRD